MICSLRSTAAMVFGSCSKAARSISRVNYSIMEAASKMSRNALSELLKGNDGLVRSTLPHIVFQSSHWSQIYGDTENVSKAVLQTHPVQKRILPRRIEFGHQVNIRLRAGLIPSDRAE